MSSFLRSALAGAGLVAVSAGAALAYPATVTADLNLRSGPGVGYGVVATMPAGAQVDVQQCLDNGWCELAFAGAVGYASGNYLEGGGPAVEPGVVVDTGPDYVAPEYYEYAYLYPPYWNNGYFYYWYGGRWRHIRRDRRWWDRHHQQFVRAQHNRPRPGAIRPGRNRPGEVRPRPERPNVVRPGRPERGAQRPGRLERGVQRPGRLERGAQQPGRQTIQPRPGPGTRPVRRPEQRAAPMGGGGGGGAIRGGTRGGGGPAVRGGDGGGRGGGAPAGRGGRDNDNRRNQ
jgi:uncharacterized protein YraI